MSGLLQLADTLGQQALWGGLLGWLGGSAIESLFHQHLGHTSRWLAQLLESIPIRFIARSLKHAHQSHKMVHHGMTYKDDHVTKFADGVNPQSIVEKGINLKEIKS